MTKNYNQLTSKDKENIVEYYYLNKKVNMNNLYEVKILNIQFK